MIAISYFGGIYLLNPPGAHFAQRSYGVQAQHRIYLLIGQELLFEHEYEGGMRHAPYAVEGRYFHRPQRDTA